MKKSRRLLNQQMEKLFLLLVAIFCVSFFQKALSQNYQNLRDIYDFDIGDKLHFHNIAYTGNGISPPYIKYDECVNILITNKYYSINNDTVFYIRNYKASRIKNNSIWDTTIVQLVSYTNLEATLYDRYGWFAFPDYSDPDYCHGRIQNTVSWPNGLNGQTTMQFVQGLGQTVYQYNYSGQGQYDQTDNRLVYYQKGTETWGTPYPVSIEENTFQGNRMEIMPNPAHQEIRINIGKQLKSKVFIFNLAGKQILNFEFSGVTDKIDISSLNPGIYFLSVKNTEGVVCSKLLVL